MGGLILDGHKLAWHRDRVEAYLAGERVAPVTMDIALTRRCNFKCVYCYGRLQDNPAEKLTLPVIRRLLDDAAEIGVKAVSLVSDGESACSPHVYEAVRHGKANGLDMAMGTNGALFRWDGRLEGLLDDLTYLRFNISAATPERFAEIHGCPIENYEIVCGNIRACVAIKEKKRLPATIGMQMVLLPRYGDQIVPLARLAVDLGVDYLVIKHCSDDESGTLGVDYSGYGALAGALREAESLSTDRTLVKAKWSKILSGGKRSYSRCYGPPLILQMSGSGLVAPCGMLFNERYGNCHIGNIAQTRFRELWRSDRYWEVMRLIASPEFDARTMCGSLCLQHKVNECLWSVREEGAVLPRPAEDVPPHVNFI
ncbi:MAG: radical SAM protein [Planctomycetota bacterium]|jgi:MoaA/NifB/PqqE/SkfB family radical SAM enzyme|nr:radical SAM protein [Planctomycetota bacterium]